MLSMVMFLSIFILLTSSFFIAVLLTLTFCRAVLFSSDSFVSRVWSTDRERSRGLLTRFRLSTIV